ncbi:MAG: Uma2 family endonuclease [Steroidobacteraceae bacterium]
MVELPHRHWISVDEYHRMAEVGLLAPDARVELIEGEIVDMAPIGNSHRGTVMRLDTLLHEALGRRAVVLCQSSIRLDDYSEPEPDLAVLKPRADFYVNASPGATDTLLVIEVSDTTWRYDRTRKVPFYAARGVPEVWLVDLPRSTLYCFRSLSGGRYTEESSTQDPGITSVPNVPGAAVDLRKLFGAD